jgi:hypothetical protein
LGIEIMDSTAFSPSPTSNSKIDGNHITFGTVYFQPHPPTQALVFSNLNQEMDLMIRSLNSHAGSLGSLRLLDLISLGPSAGKTLAATTSKTSIGYSSEAKSPVSIQPAEGNRNIVDELDEIMEKLEF